MRGLLAQSKLALDVMKSHATGDFRPYQVQISLTNRCNLKCSYCYAIYPEREQDDMTQEQLFKIIADLKELGTRRISLVGGEPLMRKDFPEIVDHIKNLGMQVAVTTNGYMVPHRIETLKKMDLVCLSVDGDKEATDKNRAQGCYDRVMKAIDLLQEHKIPVQLSAVLNRNSIPTMRSLLEFAKERKVFVGFSTLIEQTVDGKKVSPPAMPTDEEYREALDELLKLKHEGFPVLFSDTVLRYARDWKLPYEKDKLIGSEPDFDYIPCNAGRFFGIIDVNGDVYPCPATVDVLPTQNAVKVGVEQAFKAQHNHACHTCHIPCQNEINRMYSLDPKVILNILKNYKIAY